MSGEIVVASSLFHATAAAAPLLGAIVVGSLVYQAVKERREQARREAEQAARRRKQELQQWRAFQDTQQVRMQEQAARWQALQERMQTLRSADPPEAVQDPGRTHAGGFLQQAHATEQQRLRLQDLAGLLAAVPLEVGDYSAGAFDRLAEELDRLQRQTEQGPPPLDTALDTFQAMVEDSIEAARKRLAEEPRRQAARLAELEALLDRMLRLEAMAEEEEAEAVVGLQQPLLAALAAGSVGTARVQALRDELERLEGDFDAERDNRLVRQQLQTRIRVRLEAMGYRRLGQDARGTLWAIPGGEQVRMSAGADLRLAFQLQHERFAASQAPLDRAELALLRQQERRWCGDLKTLMQHLNADGFRFQVEFERQIPEEEVPMVVVQDVEEILRQQADSEQVRQREAE